jgi:uncharacterized linocin/CFP29 family protein
MNNLYRELAPVSAAAWAGIEEEAKRTFARHAAARKAVDVTGPDGLALAGTGTGHVTAIEPPGDGVTASLRDWRPVVELRVPFALSRSQVDSVERGALDPDWQPVKDAAKKTPSPRTGRSSTATPPPRSPGSGRRRPTPR